MTAARRKQRRGLPYRRFTVADWCRAPRAPRSHRLPPSSRSSVPARQVGRTLPLITRVPKPRCSGGSNGRPATLPSVQPQNFRGSALEAPRHGGQSVGHRQCIVLHRIRRQLVHQHRQRLRRIGGHRDRRTGQVHLRAGVLVEGGDVAGEGRADLDFPFGPACPTGLGGEDRGGRVPDRLLRIPPEEPLRLCTVSSIRV